MTTRRHPRTLAEAFGPYTTGPVHPMPQPVPTAHRVYGVLLAVALGVFFALFLVHYAAK